MSESDVVKACRALYAAIDLLDQTAADALGISRSELRCLNMLEREPVAPTAIAKGLCLTTGAVTSLLDRLEKQELIERLRNREDRRGLKIAATPRVYQVLGPIYRRCAIELDAAVSSLPARQQPLAVTHMQLVTEACLKAVNGTKAA